MAGVRGRAQARGWRSSRRVVRTRPRISASHLPTRCGAWFGTSLEACAATIHSRCESRLRVALGGDDGDRLDLATSPIQTRTMTLCRCSSSRRKMTRRSRFLAAPRTVASLEVGHSRTLARPCVGVEPGRKHDRTWHLSASRRGVGAVPGVSCAMPTLPLRPAAA